ncbi:hypothetical protein K4K97_11120 [Phaeobacter inhibens]|uniref:hypothetical protein n=1 Tax=Phaeobacter inhibens TaxID=221822 RepID=UPI0021A42BB5|nr:hypothetical protein [Phaeobacter inhibens]UWR79168.1 hypothetical protein K4K97_11120 [Phaeobacter inhibens]
MAALLSILSAYSALGGTDAVGSLKDAVNTSATLHEHLIAEFEYDARFLSQGIPFEGGSSFSNGVGFAYDSRQLLNSPIWYEDLPDIDITTMVFARDAGLFLRSNPWKFWSEWHKAFLAGKPLDWELQRRVALIDDAIWDAGPEAVAAEIERIRNLFELEQEIANLKGQLTTVQNTPAAALIGDNGGPPLEDAPARAFQTDLALIWKQVEELEEEIAKPSPSPSLLEKIAKTLWEISLRMAAYCGSVADGMIREGTKELAKAGAKWTAGATAVTVTAQTEGVQSVVKAIGAFVKTLQ